MAKLNKMDIMEKKCLIGMTPGFIKGFRIQGILERYTIMLLNPFYTQILWQFEAKNPWTSKFNLKITLESSFLIFFV